MSSPIHASESASGIVPPLGAPVRTRDGTLLGTIKETRGDSFKVDARYARDYWLSATLVLRADAGRVELDCDAGQIDDYRLDAPGGHTSESPLLDAQAETFATVEDRELRRERMVHGDTRPDEEQ